MNKRGNVKNIIIDMDGRLGNQMFQYAYGRKLQARYPKSKLLVSFYRISLYAKMYEKEKGWQDNLQEFNTHYETLDMDNAMLYQNYLTKKQHFLVRLNQRLLHHLPFMRRSSYFPYEKLPSLLKRYAQFLYRNGLFIYPSKTADYKKAIKADTILCHSYFEDAHFYPEMWKQLHEEFRPKAELNPQNKDIFEKINNSESVCVTIRRGDYLSEENKADFFLSDDDYFARGIKIMQEKLEKPTFFFFSDDLDYARQFAQNILGDATPYYIETAGNSLGEKIRLMSACKHFVISNSTFSWWCQFLSENPEKIVVGPLHWYPVDSINKNDGLVQKEWVKL